jgi:hypothetical protein
MREELEIGMAVTIEDICVISGRHYEKHRYIGKGAVITNIDRGHDAEFDRMGFPEYVSCFLKLDIERRSLQIHGVKLSSTQLREPDWEI